MIDFHALVYDFMIAQNRRVEYAADRAQAAGFHGVLVLLDQRGWCTYAEPHPRVPFGEIHQQITYPDGTWFEDDGERYDVEYVGTPLRN